jgi:hypothetical protein
MTRKPEPPPQPQPSMTWGEMLSRHLQTDPAEIEPPPGRTKKKARPKPGEKPNKPSGG